MSLTEIQKAIDIQDIFVHDKENDEEILSILVADDSKLQLAVICNLLKDIGDKHIEILCADNGLEAYESACQKKPDIVIIDWEMPGLTGPQVVSRIRELEKTQNKNLSYTYIILVTSVKMDDSNMEFAYKHGVDDFLSKPVSRTQLLTRFEAGRRVVLFSKKLLELKKITEKAARTDELTRIHNRNYGEERIQETMIDHARSRESLAVMFCDIDHFKQVNDAYGHRAGDEVLFQVAQFLKGSIRSNDIICRWGGDEFVIVLKRSGLRETETVLKRIEIESGRKKIFIPIKDGSGKVQRVETGVGISAGCVYGVPTMGVIWEDVLSRADEILYRMKRERNISNRETISFNCSIEPVAL